MSSNASTAENGVSDESATIPVATGRIDTTDTRTKFDVEREILCNYIEELERELVRERQRRDQVIDHYEQLLDAERQTENESTGLLRGLF
ncbi:hypothetical protein SAMN05216559_0185 [Halomicrobium zhouii]|uniref:Uncharacterized protein n=1 Tax=Halomicrobium zhouii TaxID=767519 RepID=A0A1I6K4Q0_9EURY|nr:hypothetical protein [Halomicrobium zhouii]SFR86167.1 hypothetical protein SAMN05216559_0185 [Halomicrobium zhouii]